MTRKQIQLIFDNEEFFKLWLAGEPLEYHDSIRWHDIEPNAPIHDDIDRVSIAYFRKGSYRLKNYPDMKLNVESTPMPVATVDPVDLSSLYMQCPHCTAKLECIAGVVNTCSSCDRNFMAPTLVVKNPPKR